MIAAGQIGTRSSDGRDGLRARLADDETPAGTNLKSSASGAACCSTCTDLVDSAQHRLHLDGALESGSAMTPSIQWLDSGNHRDL